jgi:ubiquinone/menaquinone biosynthesis C-methylase UbiE
VGGPLTKVASPRIARRAQLVADLCAGEHHIRRNRELSPLLAVKPGENILEVGCGTGILTEELAGRSTVPMRVVAIDSDANAIEAARYRAANAGWNIDVDFQVMDGRRLRFPDGVFDAAVCSRVLGYARSPELLLSEMARVIAPGGRILVVEEVVAVEAGVDDALRARVFGLPHPSIGRRVPDLICRLGFDEVVTTPHYFFSNVPRDLERLREAVKNRTGLLGWALDHHRCSSADIDEFLKALQSNQDEGVPWSLTVHLAVLGRNLRARC